MRLPYIYVMLYVVLWKQLHDRIIIIVYGFPYFSYHHCMIVYGFPYFTVTNIVCFDTNIWSLHLNEAARIFAVEVETLLLYRVLQKCPWDQVH
jgi:hypothetical protein